MIKKEKALLVAIRTEWLNMILNKKKIIEFRNWYVPENTIIYFYESKVNNGRGKVVSKAIVKKCYNLKKEKLPLHIDISNIGYNEQKYGIELNYIEELDPINVTEFIKWDEYKSNKNYIKTAPQSRVWIYV